MGSINRSLLAAALLSGVVIATRAGGPQIPSYAAAEEIANSGRNQRRRYAENRCNAAAVKRAKRTRRNIAARASKRT
jgi:hypothetical protein